MRNSNRRNLECPVRANLTNTANTGAGTFSPRILLGPVLVTAIAIFAAASTPTAGTTRPLSMKQLQSLVDRGELDAAEKQLWEIVVREPQNTPAITLLGVIRARQKRFLEAEALF